MLPSKLKTHVYLKLILPVAVQVNNNLHQYALYYISMLCHEEIKLQYFSVCEQN